MPKSKGTKFYAVAKGRKVGIFETWDECKAQVDGFPGSRFKGFKTQSEAMGFIQQLQGSTTSLSSSLSSNVAVPEGSRKRKGIEEECGNGDRKKVRDETTQNENASDADADAINNRPIHATGSTSNGLTFHIHFDGGARGNPGVAGAGTEIILSRSTMVQSSNDTSDQSSRAVRRSATKRIQQSQFKTVVTRICKTLIRHYLGDTFTNNQAEYQGLVCGLENVLEVITNQKYQLTSGERIALVVQGDSKLIIEQIKGAFECKSPKLKPYYLSARSLLDQIRNECQLQTGQPCQLTLEHVYRENNKVADCKCYNTGRK